MDNKQYNSRPLKTDHSLENHGMTNDKSSAAMCITKKEQIKEDYMSAQRKEDSMNALIEPEPELSYRPSSNLRVLRKLRIFNKIKSDINKNIKTIDLTNLKVNDGKTQEKEKLSIIIVKNTLDSLNCSYIKAGSQQSKDFQNICGSGLNIEVKKTDSLIVYFNDTLPSSDIYYIIIFTGKEYKSEKTNIEPQIIYINGYDLIKKDIYYLLDYKKTIEELKSKWGTKSGEKSKKLKQFTLYPRPTYKTSIKHLIDSEFSYRL